jgi:outer membrane protein assembly factor BamB
VYVAALDATLCAVQDQGDEGRMIWQKQFGEHGFTADLEANENGIIACGRDHILYSVRPSDGLLQWKHSFIDGYWIDGTRHAADVLGGQFQTSPTVVDGIVYIGGPDGFLHALDYETGERIWRFETQGRISSVPRVAEGLVFIGKNSHLDEFYAVDQKTGEPVWETRVGWTSVGATAYRNGRIFLGTVGGKMFGIDAKTGKIDWTFDAGSGKGIYPHPAVDEHRVYTGSHNGHYYAFDQDTGEPVWRTFTANENGRGGFPDSAATVLWKANVYSQKRGAAIVALDRNSGNEVWQWKQPANYLQNGTIAAHGNMIYGSVIRLVTRICYYGAIYAFNDVETGGEQLWKYDEAGGGGGLSAPVIAREQLIFGGSASVHVSSINRQTGKLNWRCYVGAPMEEGVPAIYGNKVFVHCRNGYLFAIE